MSIGTIYGQIDFPLFLILGETMVARFFPKRSCYWLRLLIVLAVSIGANFGFYFLRSIVPGSLIYIISAFVVFLLTLLGLPFCYKATIPSYLLAGTIGYCMQNSSYCLTSTIRINLPIDETENWYYVFLMLITIFSLESLLIYRLYLKGRSSSPSSPSSPCPSSPP